MRPLLCLDNFSVVEITHFGPYVSNAHDNPKYAYTRILVVMNAYIHYIHIYTHILIVCRHMRIYSSHILFLECT